MCLCIVFFDIFKMNWMLIFFLFRVFDIVEFYNVDMDLWSYVVNMMELKLGVVCIGYKGYLYVMGGLIDCGGKKVVLKMVECYDFKFNWYECLSLFFFCRFFGYL